MAVIIAIAAAVAPLKPLLIAKLATINKVAVPNHVDRLT
jgi:hypothetical protein